MFAFSEAISSRINAPKPDFARIAANYIKARPAPAMPVTTPASACGASHLPPAASLLHDQQRHPVDIANAV